MMLSLLISHAFSLPDFFPSYLTYGLHFNNKRVNYLKAKELTEKGRSDLEKIQYLLDYNWTGRCLVSHNHNYQRYDTPAALWPKIMERTWKGRTCFWTGREHGSKLEYAQSVTYNLLREHLVQIFKTNNTITCTSANKGTRRSDHIVLNKGGSCRKKQKI